MDSLVIQGGTRLVGQVQVSGSKNASLPILAASLLTDDQLVLENVPQITDIAAMSDLLHSLGVNVWSDGTGQTVLTPFDDSPVIAEAALMRRLRAGICVLGPLLAKRGFAKVALPGGCNIGLRPIELHLKGLEALGAKISLQGGYVVARSGRLQGANLFLGGPHGSTVTGTCNVMSAATLARGKTVISAAASEPEVVALAELLIAMGARISGHGTSTIEIEGVEELCGANACMVPDRIEAATLMVATAITGGDVTLTHINPADLSAPIDLLREMGCHIETQEDRLTLEAMNRTLRSVDFSALPYPGLPTDMQAQFMSLACSVQGRTLIRDQVFPHRMLHSAELCRMGAIIHPRGDGSEVLGSQSLVGTEVVATDLRAGAALVIAGLVASGNTIVTGVHHIDRGYEQLDQKLNALGAKICRVALGHSSLATLDFEAYRLPKAG